MRLAYYYSVAFLLSTNPTTVCVYGDEGTRHSVQQCAPLICFDGF